ncbi:MAG TPA: acyl-CoA thioesterase [Syntrophomonas sp.]|jgi:acyl-CoA hydrolase|nr:acyl-CoA thioesterase [Syntrophomonas sp.]
MAKDEKTPNTSILIMPQVVLPSHANAAGRMHGGEVMKLMDTAAGVVAIRHCHCNVVTANVTQLSFMEPVFIGDLVICRAKITYTGRTSMEVFVDVKAEHLRSGETKNVSEGYFVMVALDRNGRPTTVPPLILETEEERRCFEYAKQRIAKLKSEVHQD